MILTNKPRSSPCQVHRQLWACRRSAVQPARNWDGFPCAPTTPSEHNFNLVNFNFMFTLFPSVSTLFVIIWDSPLLPTWAKRCQKFSLFFPFFPINSNWSAKMAFPPQWNPCRPPTRFHRGGAHPRPPPLKCWWGSVWKHFEFKLWFDPSVINHGTTCTVLHPYSHNCWHS